MTKSEADDYEHIVETNNDGTTASVTVAESETDFHDENDAAMDDSDADSLSGSPGFDVVAAIVLLNRSFGLEFRSFLLVVEYGKTRWLWIFDPFI